MYPNYRLLIRDWYEKSYPKNRTAATATKTIERIADSFAGKLWLRYLVRMLCYAKTKTGFGGGGGRDYTSTFSTCGRQFKQQIHDGTTVQISS